MKKILKINSLFIAICFLMSSLTLSAMHKPRKKAAVNYKDFALEVVKEIGQRDDVTEESLKHIINQVYINEYVFGPKSAPNLPSGDEVDSNVKRELENLISQNKVKVSKAFMFSMFGPSVANTPTQNVNLQNGKNWREIENDVAIMNRTTNMNVKASQATSPQTSQPEEKAMKAKAAVNYNALALAVVKNIGQRDGVTEELLKYTINQFYAEKYVFGPKSVRNLPSGDEVDSKVKRELVNLISQNKVKVSKEFRDAVFAPSNSLTSSSSLSSLSSFH